MYCICCKKNIIKPSSLGSDHIDEESTLWSEEERENPVTGDKYYYTVNNQMVDNGIINIIDAGYGSKHDGDQIIIAVCDRCIDENLEDATLLYYGNYMSSNSKRVIDEIEKSKKIYRRRKNLDNISSEDV
jgi:hypothetical protein